MPLIAAALVIVSMTIAAVAANITLPAPDSTNANGHRQQPPDEQRRRHDGIGQTGRHRIPNQPEVDQQRHEDQREDHR